MAKSITSATLLDGLSLFDTSEFIAQRHGVARAKFDHAKLKIRLDEIRRAAGWRPAETSVMLLSVDPESEGQQRFQASLQRAGFETDLCHYRESFVSLPPGRSPHESSRGFAEKSDKPLASLATRIAFIIGLMARHEETNLLVVSHAFELCAPLVNLAKRVPKGRVGIAYFASLLDARWRPAGLFDARLPLKFFDLEPFGDELMGIDFTGHANAEGGDDTALNQF